jgi:hypothetical protein
MEVGDVSWHHGWALHAAPGNQLDATRYAYTVSFVDANARLLEADVMNTPAIEDSYSYADWLNDVAPGCVPEHPLLPVVFDHSTLQTG